MIIDFYVFLRQFHLFFHSYYYLLLILNLLLSYASWEILIVIGEFGDGICNLCPLFVIGIFLSISRVLSLRDLVEIASLIYILGCFLLVVGVEIHHCLRFYFVYTLRSCHMRYSLIFGC